MAVEFGEQRCCRGLLHDVICEDSHCFLARFDSKSYGCALRAFNIHFGK